MQNIVIKAHIIEGGTFHINKLINIRIIIKITIIFLLVTIILLYEYGYEYLGLYN